MNYRKCVNQVSLRRCAAVFATLLAFVLAVAGCTAAQPSQMGRSTVPSPSRGTQTHARSVHSSSPGNTLPASSTTKAGPPPKPVHIKILNSDGSQYGVGMPVIAFFSRRIKDAASLQKATVATVNGKRVTGAWYFEASDYYKGYPIEGHFRSHDFWPAHSRVFVKIPAKGLSAGGKMVYDDSLTSSWTTGARNIGVVDDSTHMLTITSDSKRYGTFPVSLGATSTPTFNGIKVIMEQHPSVCMHDTDYHYNECGIKFDSRLTYSGEYLHSAPWNVGNIGYVDTSNGCTNLLPSDAERLYHFLRIGDVVEYPNADGPKMSMGNGYGDWNIPWSQWQTGGLVQATA